MSDTETPEQKIAKLERTIIELRNEKSTLFGQVYDLKSSLNDAQGIVRSLSRALEQFSARVKT